MNIQVRGNRSSTSPASELRGQIRERQQGISNIGSVGKSPGFAGSLGMPSSVTFTLNNSAGVAAKVYKIGDQSGLVEGFFAPAVAYSQPDASSSGTVAGTIQSLGFSPVTIAGINYNATSGPTQFGSLFRYAMADLNGAGMAVPVNSPEFARPTFQNANLLTLAFIDEFMLDERKAFIISVAAAQTVTITLMFGAASFR